MNDIDSYEAGAKIIVIGVGGAGSNAVNRMIDENIPVQFYVMNTDIQSLQGSKVPSNNRIILGEEITHGLGAGGDYKVGAAAAEASAETIRNIIKGANMVFIAAGMGGGTGTGAAPVIAQICKEEKILTVAIVTRPFSFEGKKRSTNSVEGLQNLKDVVDSIIIVSNDKLLMSNGTDSISNAFKESDKVLAQSVSTVTNLILMPGIINLDFADIRNTLSNSGIALIGFGMGEGANKSIDAATAAISSPLIETSISGARRVICAVTCGPGVSLFEAQTCVDRIVEEAGKGVDVKLGVSINDQLSDQIIVSVIASDFAEEFDFTSTPNYEKPIASKENKPMSEDKSNSQIIENVKESKKEEEEEILPDFLKNKTFR